MRRWRRHIVLSRSALLACSFVALVALAGCEPSDPTPVGRGRGIFMRTCSGCHGRDGRGAMRPGLSRPPRDLTNPAFQAQMSDEQLRQSIRVGKGQMPAFGGLMGEEEIANVIAYVRSLVPPGTAPAVSPGAGGAAVVPPGTAPAVSPGASPGAGGAAAAPAPVVAPPAGAASSAAPSAAGGSSGSASAAITARGAGVP